MRIDLITLFPEMCQNVMSESIIGRAQNKGALKIECHQLRDYAFDKHKRVDDAPYGGGMGMLLMAEPIALCFEDICKQVGEKPYFIYMSPQGKVLNQQKIKEISKNENICILCGQSKFLSFAAFRRAEAARGHCQGTCFRSQGAALR